jgi:phospholipid transport system substrate-binding protein
VSFWPLPSSPRPRNCARPTTLPASSPISVSERCSSSPPRPRKRIFNEGFDIPTISRFVLGGYWRTASEAQRQDFIALFEAYVIRAYALRFNDYAGEQLKVTAARAEDGDSSMVQSIVTRPGGAPPIKVDWRVNKTDKGFKITDVVVEGVSMAVTQRQEFASVIQRNGGQIDALLKLLRERTGQGDPKNAAG